MTSVAKRHLMFSGLDLHAENAQLAQQLALLAGQIAQLQGHATTLPQPQGKCTVAMLDKFDSNQAMFPAFLGQCQLFISLREKDFPTDRAKMGFIISLLSGSAARWAIPLLTQASPLLDDFRGICNHLRLMYEDPI
ncbi:protein LDOC1-like [Thamnophis elegans]|uniref:protein LDOC1-like n=1 Tax=Thamnophis elegans TaxID=35005 RepID=UPI0013776D07|nr:protein LDOC1-like [Thamnophis elegans]